MAGTSPAMTRPLRSALALPDQDQAEGGERRAVSGPLDLPDHETRWRPVDHARALTDPEQPDGECEKAQDQEQCAHGVSPVGGFLIRSATFRGRLMIFPGPPKAPATVDRSFRSKTIPATPARESDRVGRE